jgi:hypothetical protein
MSTPRTPFPRSEEKVSPISPHAEIPIGKLDRKDLLGKKMYDHQGNFLGKVVSVIKDDAGEILSVQLRATVTREARVPANQVNIKPVGGTLTKLGNTTYVCCYPYRYPKPQDRCAKFD